MDLYKPQKYPLHDQEYQKHFLHFFLCSVEKTSVRPNFCYSGDWSKPNHFEIFQCLGHRHFCLSVTETDKQISRKEKS